MKKILYIITFLITLVFSLNTFATFLNYESQWNSSEKNINNIINKTDRKTKSEIDNFLFKVNDKLSSYYDSNKIKYIISLQKVILNDAYENNYTRKDKRYFYLGYLFLKLENLKDDLLK
jgi:hypothetical protein